MEAIEQTQKNRMTLLLIAGIPLVMVLAATWLWYFVARGDLDLVGALGTANRGTLVRPPRQLDDVELFEDNGLSFKYADLEPKWTLLVTAPGGRCELACEQSLYVTRQIHVALGKDFPRVRRFYASEGKVADTQLTVQELSDQRPVPESFAALLESEHRGIKALELGEGAYNQLFAEHTVDPSTWYLVDPAGWIMMYYNNEVSYKDVISDLKFLLKNSSE
jgi:hypothetical protein